MELLASELTATKGPESIHQLSIQILWREVLLNLNGEQPGRTQLMSDNENPSVDYSHAHDSLESLFDVAESAESADGTTEDPDERPEFTHENWLTTGIEALDRYLNGGIPPGRLVSFAAPADTQGELFVKQITSQHNSLYLTSLRPEWEVEETVRDHIQKVGSVNGGQVDTRVRNLNPDARLAEARDYIEYIDDGTVVVVDSVDELEREPESEYVDFLHRLKQRLWEAGSVGLLCCFEGDTTPLGRDITYRMSDIIWQLRRSVNVSGVEYLLIVSKFRGGNALTEPVKLELTDEIAIDTSRDIA